MSREIDDTTLRATLNARPSGARVVVGTLEGSLTRSVQRRCDAARAEGESRARDFAAKALDEACARLDAAREVAATKLARSAVELAVEIARVLVRRDIDTGRHDIQAMVRESLAASGVGRGTCVVHLHPLDAETLSEIGFRSGTTIEADEAVARGDVHVSTPHGLLVREVPEALRAIHDRLLAESA